jgi:hypothetical protein
MGVEAAGVNIARPLDRQFRYWYLKPLELRGVETRHELIERWR